MPTLLPYYDTYACTGPRAESAPELVLLHGWGLHSAAWDTLVPTLLMHFQVTVIDLPGMGRSPLPKAALTLEAQVDAVLAVAPAKAIWMGWSLGGELALAAAAAHPERVQALVMVASNPSFVQREGWPQAMPVALLQQFIAFYDEDPEATLIRFLSLQCQGSARMKDDIRFMQELVYLHGLPAPRALREGLWLLRDADLRSAWSQLVCPALALFGARDALVPVAVADAMRSANPRAQVEVIANASHVPFLAEREALERVLLPFLLSVPA